MEWLEHGGKIPSLKIPLEGLTVIKLMKFVSPEEAKLFFDKRGERKMTAKQTPAERASKRHKKTRAEEEDTCNINTFHYYNKYLMGANEDDEEFYAQQQSIITGGINAQQLEAMEKILSCATEQPETRTSSNTYTYLSVGSSCNRLCI